MTPFTSRHCALVNGSSALRAHQPLPMCLLTIVWRARATICEKKKRLRRYSEIGGTWMLTLFRCASIFTKIIRWRDLNDQ